MEYRRKVDEIEERKDQLFHQEEQNRCSKLNYDEKIDLIETEKSKIWKNIFENQEDLGGKSDTHTHNILTGSVDMYQKPQTPNIHRT